MQVILTQILLTPGLKPQTIRPFRPLSPVIHQSLFIIHHSPRYGSALRGCDLGTTGNRASLAQILLKLIYRIYREEIIVEDEAAVRLPGHATMQERYSSSQHLSPVLDSYEANETDIRS